MSETMPERAPERSSGGGVKGTFTTKIGPLPMWAWIAVIAAALVAWRVYAGKKAAATDSTGDSTSAADVPQFVNQTYVTATPPVQGPPPVIIRTPGPPPRPRPETLTRTWTAPVGGVSDLAEIAQRLTGTADPGRLHPANKIAENFINGPFKKHRNAKVPKGAVFTYTEGIVTPAAGTPPAVK